jgi:hypothetical protein
MNDDISGEFLILAQLISSLAADHAKRNASRIRNDVRIVKLLHWTLIVSRIELTDAAISPIELQ